MEEKYFVTVDNKQVKVSHDVYRAFNKREVYMFSKNLISYNMVLADNKFTLEEVIPDKSIPSFEDYMLNKSVIFAINQLPEIEKNMIIALFFDQRSQREVGEKYGLKQTTVSYKKNQILKKLRYILENNLCYSS